MGRLVTLWWRDIPAQVIAGSGRRAAKIPLPDRFAEAIDRAAMRAGLAGEDGYLAQWRRVDEGALAGEAAAVARARVREIEADWPDGRLKAAALAGGVERGRPEVAPERGPEPGPGEERR
jgi:hypothetical protein